MSQWIETERSTFVNLAHVRRITPIHPENGIQQLSLELDDNSHALTHKRDRLSPIELAELLATVLPASPGQEALSVATNSDTERPTEVRVDRYPIVGWRIRCHPNFPAAEPILPPDFPFYRLMIMLPDARVLEPFVGEYDSIDDMKAEVLRQEQQTWGLSHAPAHDTGGMKPVRPAI
jgi:hypothetical protein